jgi:hypothetical protein
VASSAPTSEKIATAPRNVWHSAAIRSTIYTLGAPGRLVKGLFRRDGPVG